MPAMLTENSENCGNFSSSERILQSFYLNYPLQHLNSSLYPINNEGIQTSYMYFQKKSFGLQLANQRLYVILW